MGRNFEFLLPDSMEIGKVIKLILRILMEEYPGINVLETKLCLLEKQSFLKLNPKNTVAECGMADGREYVLM